MQHNQRRNISLTTSLKHLHLIKCISHQKVTNLVHIHLDLMKTSACVCPKTGVTSPLSPHEMCVTCILKPSNLALRDSLLMGEETLV